MYSQSNEVFEEAWKTLNDFHRKPSKSFYVTYASESDLLEATENFLSGIPGIKWFRVVDRYNKGYSDILICVHGWFVAAELKAADGEASPHQIDFIDDIKNAGGIGGVCFTVNQVANLVQEAIRRGGYQ